MKIAFTSCADHINDPAQAAWREIAQHAPDTLVLLGDNIYMDYGLGPHPYRNGAPKELPLATFSAAMYSYYEKQWGIASFQEAIKGRPVFAIWDDHDFGWNYARAGGADDGSGEFMPARYRAVSRAHFEQFRRALTDKPAEYPPNSVTDPAGTPDLGSIQQYVDLSENIRLLLLDGRTFRETRARTNWMLGEAQWQWMRETLMPKPYVNLIASGTTLKDWKRYQDFDHLKQLGTAYNLLVLSGDVHEPDIKSLGKIVEATASAVAQPAGPTVIFGKKSEIFGLLTTDPDNIGIDIYQGPSKIDQGRISIANWEQVE